MRTRLSGKRSLRSWCVIATALALSIVTIAL
jgi:hypothetical protein